MKPRDLFALCLVVLASAATLFVLQSPNITGSYFADYGPVWTDEQTTYYLAEGVALRLNLDQSFAGPLPMKYKISESDQLYAYIDGKNLVVTPAPGASGTLTLIVTATDGSTSAEQTLAFVIDTPQEEEPAYESSIDQYYDKPKPVQPPPAPAVPQSSVPLVQQSPSEPPGQEKKTEQSSDYIYSEQGERVGRKISDNPDFEINFTYVGRKGNDFVIEFYHNASEELPAWVEGAIVTVSDKAKPKKNISISIPLDGKHPKGKIPHFKLHIGGNNSESYEFGITIINVQSYPSLGGNWTVLFNTTGTANLSITGINGTLFGEDLEFLDLKCDNTTFPHTFDNITVHAENYSCDETGSEVSKVLTTGKHTLQFTFGDDIEYAYNLVTLTDCATITSSDLYRLGNSINGARTCINITVSNVELDCNGFTINYSTAGGDGEYGVNVSNSGSIGGLNNITVRNCIIQKVSNTGAEGVAIFFAGNTNHSRIINNTLRTNGTSSNFGIRLFTNNNNVTILNNSIHSKGTVNDNDGIEVGGTSTNITIVGNNITTTDTTRNRGIFLQAIESLIENNTISTNGSQGSNQGIFIQGRSNNKIINNTIITNGTGNNTAILLQSIQSSNPVNHTTIINNTIRTNGTLEANIGIHLEITGNGLIDNINITENRITTNGTTDNYGIDVDASSSRIRITDNNITADGRSSPSTSYGVVMTTISGANVTGNRITTYGASQNDGIVLSASSSNNISSNTIITNGNASNGTNLFSNSNNNILSSNNITTVNGSSHAIVVRGGSGNSFNFNLVNASHQSSFDWRTEFQSGQATPENNTAINLTLIRNGINVTLQDYNGTYVKALLSTESRANVNNPGQISLNKFVNATNNTVTSWLFLNITYFQSEITGIPESTIRIWRFNDTENTWFDDGFFQSSGLSATNNIVFANITNFSTFGAFGSVLFVNKTDDPDPVNISGFLNYTIFINASKGNATNITVNDTYPTQAIFVSSEPTPDSGTNNYWSIGNLAENQTFRINISVQINDTTSNGTIITNRANVSFTNETGSRLNTTAIESTTVLAPLTNITACPITINNSAIMSQNVTASLTDQQSCITFGANAITLDCQNFAITGNGSGIGINITNKNNSLVRNCVLINFTTGILSNLSNFTSLFNDTANNISLAGADLQNSTNGTISGGYYFSSNGFAIRVNNSANASISYLQAISTSGTGIIVDNTATRFVIQPQVNINSTSGTALYLTGPTDSGTMSNINITTNNGTAMFLNLNNTGFSRIQFRSNNTWIQVGNVNNTNGDLLVFNASNGSIEVAPTAPAVAFSNGNNSIINQSNLNITFNVAYLNSTNLSFMNKTGQISLNGITFSNPKPTVDFEDDGTFVDCSGAICTEVSYTGGVYVYNVTRFTSYSSSETTINACGTISNSSLLGSNISAAATCITFGASNISLDCNGYTITYDTGGTGGDGVVANDKTNITVRNCIIIDVTAAGSQGVAIDMHDVQDGSYYNNTIYTNSTTNGYGMFLRNNITNNLIENSTITARGSSSNNIGIYFSAIANARNFNNRVAGNIIFSNGTDANYGIFFEDNNSNSTITQNNITTNGSGTVNYGIYLDAATSGHEIKGFNISFNRVTTNGSSNSQEGIRLVTHIFNTLIANNTIETGVRSPVAGNSHYGINLLNGAGNATIVGNFIGTRGSSDGIQLSGFTFPDFVENITIINNTIDTGGASGDGIDMVQNSRHILIVNNTIMTGNQSRRAGAAHGGIGITGITASLSNVTIFNNSITTNGSGAGNNGVTLNNFANASVSNNTISTFGTTDNYGISFASGGMINATVENNTIFASGTSIQNQGIRTAGGNMNQDILIRFNNITTNGTSSNTGLFLNNIIGHIASNTIRTTGTSTGNIGIAFDSNAQNSTIANNTIDTNGTDSNHGIATIPAVGSSTFGNFIENNTIRARAPGSSTIGLRLVNTNAVNNTARNNNISVNGTTSVIGIQITGTTVNNRNFVENNTVFVNATGASSRGIIISTTAATAATSISNNNVTMIITSTDVRALSVEAVTQVNNTYQNNTFIVQRGTGALFYVVGSSNQHFNNTVVNASDGTNMIWIDAAAGSNNNFTNTTFANANGSIRFNGTIEYTPTATDLTQVFMNISRNNTRLNSSTFSAFNTTAQLVFFNITFTDPKPMYNLSSTLPYEDCPSSICTEHSFDGFTYIYNVTRFTNFSSSENGTPVADLVVLQGDYTANITLQQSVICTFRSDNLSNASGCTVVANNDTAYALRNNGTISFGLNVSASGCPFESGCIQQIRLNGTNSSSQSSSCNLALNFITVPNTGAQLNIHKNVSAGEELHVHLNYTFSVPLTPPGAKNVTYTFTAVTDSPYYDPNC